jgi:hypothetical protein
MAGQKLCGGFYALACPAADTYQVPFFGTTCSTAHEYCDPFNGCTEIPLRVSFQEDALLVNCEGDGVCLGDGLVCNSLGDQNALCFTRHSPVEPYQECYGQKSMCREISNGDPKTLRLQLKKGDSLEGLLVYLDVGYDVNGNVNIAGANAGTMHTSSIDTYNYYKVKCSAYELTSGKNSLLIGREPSLDDIWYGIDANATSKCQEGGYIGGYKGVDDVSSACASGSLRPSSPASTASFKIANGMPRGITLNSDGWDKSKSTLTRGSSYDIYCASVAANFTNNSTSVGVKTKISVTMSKFPSPSVIKPLLRMNGFIMTHSILDEDIRCAVFDADALGMSVPSAKDVYDFNNTNATGYIQGAARRSCVFDSDCQGFKFYGVETCKPVGNSNYCVAEGTKASFFFGNLDLTVSTPSRIRGGRRYTTFCAKKVDSSNAELTISPPTSFYTPGFTLPPRTLYVHDAGLTTELAVVGSGSLSGQQRVTCGVHLATITPSSVYESGGDYSSIERAKAVTSMTGIIGSAQSADCVENAKQTFVFASGLNENTEYNITCVMHPIGFVAPEDPNDPNPTAFKNLGLNTSYSETTLSRCPGGTYNQRARPGEVCDFSDAGSLANGICSTYGGLYRHVDYNASIEPPSWSSQCQVCNSGMYTPLQNKNFRCIQCVSGRVLEDNATNATIHDSFRNGVNLEEDTCTACTPGKYQTEPGQAKCTLCEQGKAMDESIFGARVECECQICLPGTFQPSKGKTRCNWCERGQFTDRTESISCSVCSPDTPISVGKKNITTNEYDRDQAGNYVGPFVTCIESKEQGPESPTKISREYNGALGVEFSWDPARPNDNGKQRDGFLVEWSLDPLFNNNADLGLTFSQNVSKTTFKLSLSFVPRFDENGTIIQPNPATDTMVLPADPHHTVTYFRVKAFRLSSAGARIFEQPVPPKTTVTLVRSEPWTTTAECTGGLKYLQTFQVIQNNHPMNDETGTKKPIDTWECTPCPKAVSARRL